MPHAETILLVDDSATRRYTLKRLLTRAGFTVREAATGTEALRAVEEDLPGLILLDVNLPDIDGMEVCRRLRAAPRTNRIPILHVSATYTSANDQLEGFESGADGYLVEPLEPEVMLATVRGLLRARAAERELAEVRDELAARVDELTRLRELTNRLASRVDLDAVLGEILNAVTDIQGTGMGNLLLWDAGEGALISAATVGIPPRHRELLTRVAPGEGPCGIAFVEKRPVVVEDTETDPICAPFRDAARACGYRAVYSTPLLTFRGEVLGSIAALFPTPHRPSESDVRVMDLYARQAAQAVENARLYGQADEGRRILDVLMHHVPDGIVILDTAGTVRAASRVALETAGISDAPLPGASYQRTLSGFRMMFSENAPQPATPDRFPSSRAIRTGEVVRNEEWLLERPDGTRLDLLCNAAPVRDSSGAITGCVVTFRDITDRKVFERRLREMQKLESVGLLAGGVAHDFNNLLTSVLGGASLAIDMVPETHPIAPVLRDIVSSGERAARLTAQLLAYAGKGRFVVKGMDLSETVRQMTGLLRNSVPVNTDLRLELGSDIPHIQADAGQIQQLILSLVMNAAEAIGENAGVVTLRMGVKEVGAQRDSDAVGELAPGRYVCLEVRDTGCGMDESVRARIFEPFFTTKFVGRGLGLPAALGIARGHKGGFEIETAPGLGSAFRVLFPAVEDRTGRAGRTILVVDDEELVVRVVELTLERGGFRPLLARTGQEAVALFEAHHQTIEAVILDLKLPGMSGGEVLERMRTLDAAVKVLVSTAYDEAEALAMIRGAGISGFIRKPYTSQMLLEKVRQVVGKG